MQIGDPFDGAGLTIPIVWYFAPDGAKTYYGVNAFTSGVWDRDTPALPPQLGEQPPYAFPYYGGENVWQYTGQCIVGTPDQFANGLSAADLRAPPAPLPECCTPAPLQLPLRVKLGLKLRWIPMVGLELWLRADDLIPLGDGTPVSTWPDQSGSGNDATQAGVFRPVIRTTVPGVAAVVIFAGAQWMQLVRSVGDNDGTFLAVVRGGGTPHVISTQFILGGRLTPHWDSFDKITRPNFGGTDFHRDQSAFGIFSPAPLPLQNLYGAKISGTDCFLSFNSHFPSTPVASINPGPSAMATVGSQVGGVNAFGLALLELMVWGRVLTADEEDVAVRYLAGKWHLSVS